MSGSEQTGSDQAQSMPNQEDPMIPEKVKEILKHEGVVAIVTSETGGLHRHVIVRIGQLLWSAKKRYLPKLRHRVE